VQLKKFQLQLCVTGKISVETENHPGIYAQLENSWLQPMCNYKNIGSKKKLCCNSYATEKVQSQPMYSQKNLRRIPRVTEKISVATHVQPKKISLAQPVHSKKSRLPHLCN
jgi:hypothetical protein